MKHLVPKNVNEKIYDTDYKNVVEDFLTRAKSSYHHNSFNPYLMQVDKSVKNQTVNLHGILIKAIDSIVQDYPSNKYLQQVLPLKPRQLELVKFADKKAYELFYIRPDFLISDSSNDIKICEFNGRFTTNGLMAAYFLNEQMNKRFYHEKGIEIEQEVRGIINQYLKKFDIKKDLFLLREEEVGEDLKLLKKYLVEIGGSVIDIKPSDLRLALNGKIMAKGKICEQMIIELRQYEIDKIPINILYAIIDKVNYVNDIRTIYIVHDKRFFSLLSNEKIMNQYLNTKELAVLKKCIIPTFYAPSIKKKLLQNKDDWVLKKYLGGKGEEMYLGKETNQQLFQKIINEKSEEYIAQPFVKQKKSNFMINGKFISCNVVGMIMSLNRKYLGTGFFRVSPKSIISVTDGGSIIVPSYK